MKVNKIIWMLVMLGLVAVLAAACGGGDDDDILPPDPNPEDNRTGGDPDEFDPIGVPQGQFTIPGGFGDLRGVAASQEYVYVGDASTLYAFDKNGNLVNTVAAPSTIQAVGVFPPMPEADLPFELAYFYGGFPVIAFNPVGGVGYIRIYGPNLDTMTTREDAPHPDAQKYIDLPAPVIIPPAERAPLVCVNVYDMKIDRFGSILVTVDIDIPTTPYYPDFERALQIMNNANGFAIESGGQETVEDEDGEDITTGSLCFDNVYGNATGDMGTLGIDTFFPYNRPETRYTWYTGHFNLVRDFVGVSFIEFDPITRSYSVGSRVGNDFGYTRVIGEGVGSAPGSFNQNPPVNPDGQLEDPDLTNGGPSGIGVDPLSDEVYICDPGNRRIQVFDPDSIEFLRQVGDGTRGSSGSSFIAPSEVFLDLEGNLFVCDVNNLRVIRGSYPDRHFGNVGGTVRNAQLGFGLESATITLGNELGTLAVRSSNINGDYLISNLLTGTYYMTATKFNYDTDTATVQIISDRTVRVDFNLNPEEPAVTGAYTGTIIDSETNLPLREVRIQLVGTSIETETDSIGRFQLNNILPGTYQVVFTHEDYETLTRDVEVFSGQTTTDPILQMVPLED
jgi:hypothetical protein